jgi:surfeit locus 1 family protein
MHRQVNLFMPRRNVVFAVIAAAAALGCARLGIWQLDRLASRRARNAVVAARLSEAPVALTGVPSDTAESRFRRVRIAGLFDFSHEMVLIDRVSDGSPGVDLVTPLQPDSGVLGDTIVLVNRGWVYAGDGMSIDQLKWREPAHIVGTGYLVTFVGGMGQATLSSATHRDAYRWLDRGALETQLGHPIANFIVVLEGDAATPASGVSANGNTAATPHTPVRRSPPPLDEGPHLSYAIQWFSFALIIIAGTTYGVFLAPPQRNPLEIAR